jgi:hypothetical protein
MRTNAKRQQIKKPSEIHELARIEQARRDAIKAANAEKTVAEDEDGEEQADDEDMQPEVSVLMGGDNSAEAKKKKKSDQKGGPKPKQMMRATLSTEYLEACNYRGAGLDLDGTYLQWNFSQKAALNGVHDIPMFVSTMSNLLFVIHGP